ncbi:hypothetical protein GLOIN_2v1470347 [Rhizophagus irregularis DAOM 181602=DAOM 197198]|uniref:Uncharacterized protein n=1 Tax=Rhizophagus irregularis (strain DAOM 181602 / DAOM 197198 / MUCL 43194) TaxID=747089 RepID=A0A2P4QWR1_RHIID|nr:hypothetical protein GLOIN_2v1470347 [Rhizophagus irregularis DAOM 181602=DAOM 197198]POG82086.1 hypothetical protein GLOIN_2v1470347 [Rhizophagus irregularis DAOM 181602=DAOM 197198]|eukprot:XP_025188952.1 hypothetical protein GLOIN_2v1470347 [Rhizophagus irregularis DAOM 181602=DAOM 197198]
MVTIFTFNATTHIPTDPQVLAVYNGLNRAQRATYDTLATDRERSIFLNGIAEERRKSELGYCLQKVLCIILVYPVNNNDGEVDLIFLLARSEKSLLGYHMT